MDQSSKSTSTDPTAQTSKLEKTPTQIAFEKCQKVRAEGKRLDGINANFVAEARRLQGIWITNEMTTLRDTGKITAVEWKIFSDFTSKPLENPKTFIQILDVMDKVVKLGYIRPYLPNNVVEIGSKAALGDSSSDYYVRFPECFSDTDYKVIKMVAEIPKLKNAWTRKLESPMDLIP